jgi:hypothetical protein
LHAASKGVVAGIPYVAFLVSIVQVRGRVQRADWDVGGGFRIDGFCFVGNIGFPDPANLIKPLDVSCAPLGLSVFPMPHPRACALGYNLAPLRGSV